MINKKILYPSFISSRNLIHGVNSINSLKKITFSRVAIILSKSFSANDDLLQKIKLNINCMHLEIIIKDWSGSPTIKKLSSSLKKIEKSKAEVIIAIGGASIIDAAKILWMFYEHPEISSDI